MKSYTVGIFSESILINTTANNIYINYTKTFYIKKLFFIIVINYKIS